ARAGAGPALPRGAPAVRRAAGARGRLPLPVLLVAPGVGPAGQPLRRLGRGSAVPARPLELAPERGAGPGARARHLLTPHGAAAGGALLRGAVLRAAAPPPAAGAHSGPRARGRGAGQPAVPGLPPGPPAATAPSR